MKTRLDKGAYTKFYEKIGNVAEEVKFPVFHWCIIAGIDDADTIKKIDEAFANPESQDAGRTLLQLINRLQDSDITIDATTKSKEEFKKLIKNNTTKREEETK